MIKRFLFLALVGMLSSCATTKVVVPKKISSVRGIIPGTDSLPVTIVKSKYSESLKNPKELERLRLVPIIASGSDSESLPEYRLFDIQAGSPPAILGLMNSDILVGANDFAIYDPLKFKQYLILLQNEKSAFIEIRRDGQPIIFRYQFE